MEVDEFLAHYGVVGMKWGVRKDHPDGVSRHVSRDAEKDAKEHARAKSYFGEGAGTRRKLIKQTVDAKSARVPGYKKAFDHHLAKQDMSKHASKAISERSSTDRKTRNKQRRGAVARRLTGEMGTQAAFVALLGGGAAYLSSQKGRAHLKTAMSKINNVKTEFIRRQGAKKISKLFETMNSGPEHSISTIARNAKGEIITQVGDKIYPEVFNSLRP